MRLLQEMFETHLRGLFTWGDLDFHAAEDVDKVPGQRKQAFGKYKEIVSIRFGDFDLTVESSNERPPLGRVTLLGPHGSTEENSLDAAAMTRVADIIKSHKRIASYV